MMKECMQKNHMRNQQNSMDTLGQFPIAMTYVPWQRFGHTYDLCKALRVGTIFPELDKPFCGKRGACK